MSGLLEAASEYVAGAIGGNSETRTVSPYVPVCQDDMCPVYTPTLNETLTVRGSRYGEFDEQARVTQNIKAAMRDSANWNKLPPLMREALEMDASKTARILNGDFNYDDSWHDKAGYATLVENYLHKIFKKA